MLETLFFEETEDTPKIMLDQKNSIFEISGKSMPENSIEFYAPIMKWIAEYIKNPNKSTNFIFKIEYFNSSSAKRLYELFTELQKIKQTGNEIKICWYYEPDDRMMETKGNEFKSILGIPFELIPEL